MTHIDYDRLDESIAELDEQIAAMQAERVAKGLPAEPPEPFIPEAIGIILCRRVKPAKEAIIQYATLTHKAGQVLPINLSDFDRFQDDITLLKRACRGLEQLSWGAFLSQSLRDIEETQQALAGGQSTTELAEDLARSLYINLKLLDAAPSLESLYDASSAETYANQTADAKAALERYEQDPAVFEKELAEYRARYEQISHLY
ncbi:hypothetical protein CEF21_14990 [Bacillus sp. FJAT-42376]|uniref:hypothetical protein n=1 Tax=Bacillus sp. FJAT-42376 TaxID=2014076 RepID=UPI000F4DD9E0|nr:hypothetical protein [Bacillus sp. FJAT-42376]AZB43501.1 hypothetical protein CEF21_14990 [Bacillus sp. FJAT-42376]